LKRYLRIYRSFVSSSLARELEFRANFLAKVAQNAMWIGFAVLIVLVVFGNTNSVAGWNRADSFVLLGTVSVMNAAAQALFFSLTEIPEQVRRGTLDYVVTRPIDTQFWVSMRRFNFDQIGSFFAGIAMLIVGLAGSHHGATAFTWVAFWVSVIAATSIFYSFNLALMTTGIWLVRVDNLWVLSESVSSIARYPVDIYGSNLKKMFTYFVPLALLATVPATQLVREVSLPYLATAIAWAVFATILARLFWQYALRHYGSASS
jgi:ABC-2 type transport system permease protein